MGGLGKLFSRIIPIIMLVCFVCLGVTHTFQQIGAENKTYLTTETINVGTEENPNNITYYNLDIASYISNINMDILKQSTENTIDTNTLRANLNVFNDIWKDGYHFLELPILHTIANGILLAINFLITFLNVIFIIPRLISGIILTAMSLIGININTQGIITNFLKGILEYLNIPLINAVQNQDSPIYESINNTYWHFNNIISGEAEGFDVKYNFEFQCFGNTYYGVRFFTTTDTLITGDLYVVGFFNKGDGTSLPIYNDNKWGGWAAYQYQDIIVINTYDDTNNNLVAQFLGYNAVRYEPTRDVESTPIENETKTEDTELKEVVNDTKKYIRYAI